ncbi:MAG: NusG domain II-containing protein [Clostridia bacterium]|nr:NusG domain II-containing protein [Clostridia bacterium]
MLKSNIKWVLIFALLCVLCITLHIVHTKGKSGKLAVIKKDGETVKTIDLSAVSEPYEIRIESDNGYNIIYVEKGKISIKDADCPDRLCVKQGTIENGAYPIVCLPHRVTVSIEKADGEVDAVSGGGAE